jgi:hypothetical protein
MFGIPNIGFSLGFAAHRQQMISLTFLAWPASCKGLPQRADIDQVGERGRETR